MSPLTASTQLRMDQAIDPKPDPWAAVMRMANELCAALAGLCHTPADLETLRLLGRTINERLHGIEQGLTDDGG